MTGIYLLLGSNLKDRELNLTGALQALEHAGIRILKTSRIYESEPWGVKDQPWFLNQAVEVEFYDPPEVLLTKIKAIEVNLGRKENQKWGPRLIDIDILYFSDLTVNTSTLTIPHQELPNRKFVLMPLCDLNPDNTHPVLHKSNAELLSICQDSLDCSIYHITE